MRALLTRGAVPWPPWRSLFLARFRRGLRVGAIWTGHWPRLQRWMVTCDTPSIDMSGVISAGTKYPDPLTP